MQEAGAGERSQVFVSGEHCSEPRQARPPTVSQWPCRPADATHVPPMHCASLRQALSASQGAPTAAASEQILVAVWQYSRQSSQGMYTSRLQGAPLAMGGWHVPVVAVTATSIAQYSGSAHWAVTSHGVPTTVDGTWHVPSVVVSGATQVVPFTQFAPGEATEQSPPRGVGSTFGAHVPGQH